jgi:hypothetical protein
MVEPIPRHREPPAGSSPAPRLCLLMALCLAGLGLSSSDRPAGGMTQDDAVREGWRVQVLEKIATHICQDPPLGLVSLTQGAHKYANRSVLTHVMAPAQELIEEHIMNTVDEAPPRFLRVDWDVEPLVKWLGHAKSAKLWAPRPPHRGVLLGRGRCEAIARRPAAPCRFRTSRAAGRNNEP